MFVQLFFLLAVCACASAASWEWQISVDVFEGTLAGFFNEAAPDISACADQTINVYSDFQQAMSLLKTDQNTVDEIEQGLGVISSALSHVQALIQDCGGIFPEIQKLESTLGSFSNPVTLVFHVGEDLIVNGVNIYDEIMQAVSLWENQSYRQSGYQIGEALEQLLIGNRRALADQSKKAIGQN
jgi:hypothetical protein